MGLFDTDWLGLRATRQLQTLRYAEFSEVSVTSKRPGRTGRHEWHVGNGAGGGGIDHGCTIGCRFFRRETRKRNANDDRWKPFD